MLSVITPVFNGERFLASCIENVLGQAGNEVEHLLIDGGSSDGSVETIRKYASMHPHIRWVSEKDRGQSDAMNKGIGLARGEYLSFLNADDFYEPGTLRRITAMLLSRPSSQRPAFLLGNCRIVDDQGQTRGINRPGPVTHSGLLLGPSKAVFPINPSAYFYTRALHDRVGLYQVEEHQHMDLEFILRATRETVPEYHDEIWGNFRLYAETKSARAAVSYDMVARWRQILLPFQDALPWPQRMKIKFLDHFYRVWNHRYARALRHPRTTAIKIAARLNKRRADPS